MVFDIKKAIKKGLPPFQIEQMKKANRISEILSSCDVHDFDLKDIKTAILGAKVTNWTAAKCKCKKCGGEVFALYAGGYMDAVKRMKEQALQSGPGCNNISGGNKDG